ncbi:MAG: hypothetical protein JST04_04020 [Bdellovibrionales bacterium]|nr:hypothetical protein [Bdellovibrionales bacterium]
MIRLRSTLIHFAVSLAFAAGAFAEELTPPTHSFQLWGGIAGSTTHSQNADHTGALLVGGIALPVAPADRQSIRFSVSRLFDDSGIARYNLLAHFGYRFTERFGAGLLGGVEYLERGDSSHTYVKPLIGAELNYGLVFTPDHAASLFLAYESAQGSTGTLAFDGGSDSISARIISLGLALSIGLF